MTDPTRPSDATVTLVARATLTLSVRAIVYQDARCPECERKIAAVPGPALLDIQKVASNAQASGRGIVLSCKRCATLSEIIARPVTAP